MRVDYKPAAPPEVKTFSDMFFYPPKYGDKPPDRDSTIRVRRMEGTYSVYFYHEVRPLSFASVSTDSFRPAFVRSFVRSAFRFGVTMMADFGSSSQRAAGD
jgi:hypothetical protein